MNILSISLLLTSIFASIVKSEIYMMCEREGEIAFTYDQGPSQYTGKLLVTLAKHKVKATFHISPDYLENPVILAYLRKSALDGHLIGIFVKEEVKVEEVKDYLGKASAAIQRYTNYKPQYLRFPAPGPSEEMMKAVTGLGYVVTSYNLDSQDYNSVNAPTDSENVYLVYKDIFDQILPPAKGSFIAIQRDIVQASVDQSDAIIQYALDKGYKPVRLDQCIRKPQKEDKSEKNNNGKGKDTSDGHGSGSGVVEEEKTKSNGNVKDPVRQLETSTTSDAFAVVDNQHLSSIVLLLIAALYMF